MYIYIYTIYTNQAKIIKKYTVNIFKRQPVCIYLLFRLLSNMDFEERDFEK